MAKRESLNNTLDPTIHLRAPPRPFYNRRDNSVITKPSEDYWIILSNFNFETQIRERNEILKTLPPSSLPRSNSV